MNDQARGKHARLWHHRRPLFAVVAVLLLMVVAGVWMTYGQRRATLGEFHLESGQVISDAVIGYRTAGHLNAARTNAVLVPTWFRGTTGQLSWQIGPGKLVDSSRYFVIMVDALANGVSSSPSTSTQDGNVFPVITIADMVRSQHKLVTTTLGVSQLHAVVGISMGGMQALEWAVSYPTFMKKTVSIVGSPQAQADDRQRWGEGITWVRTPVRTRAIAALSQWKPRTVLAELWLDPDDYVRQVEAMMAFDLTRNFGGSLPRLAAAIRSELMIAGAWSDADVNPKPAFELGHLARGEVLELEGRCGHQAPSCERETLWPAIARFLAR